MAAKKGGLGRGLESLFEETVRDVGNSSMTLPLREIEPDKDQPRKDFAEQPLAELAASIAEHGVLQPITVRPCTTGGYKIIAGERRWRAARLAGLTEIPVLVKDVTQSQAMELALIENLQREDLDPVEEAFGYQQLMERCGLTQEQAAQRLGKSRSSIANSLRMLALPQRALEWLQTGHLTPGHAKVILGLPTSDLQEQAAQQVVEHDLNVRQTEVLCKRLAKAPSEPGEPSPAVVHALATEVEVALREALGNRVKVQYKDGQGSLTVQFHSDEQLRAFANLLGQYDKES
ncbi:MAG: ParB/RepB/Spo0J family partition protein [Candidatus Fournierella pullistercoris]|uniref:ParB/RepB/Spo0J family partition protein n=1 Tax=Candidatus Allofournierella pullistercoris TaxID=2838597 RepID=A0A948WQZ4_9FIRM|nr:ParB/RepB/Spo0J family partition protein [Candidatus Fournierella pullistercoris]